MKVLVVDDLSTNRKLFRVILEPEGHEVLEAADGLEALALLETQVVDVIISDILMPGMDGYRFCYEVRRNERLRHLPIIICSSTYTSPADARLALEVGADKYFKKPAPPAAILEALQEFSSAAKYKVARPAAIAEEQTLMKEYSEVLVRKLEERNSELEKTQAELIRINRDLEERVKDRTAELEAVNVELEAFNRSVSHDLRSPLSEVSGYAQLILTNQPHQLDPVGREFVGKIYRAGQRMDTLIRELMKLSKIKESQLCRSSFDLSSAVHAAAGRLTTLQPQRLVDFIVAPELTVEADGQLVQIALENLLSNAWKYTAKCSRARIEFGQLRNNSSSIFFVRDNGAGFEMTKAGRLFKPFERLHSQSEYFGTGIGLTIVQRVIARHGGRIWAEGKSGEGATFYFTLA